MQSMKKFVSSIARSYHKTSPSNKHYVFNRSVPTTPDSLADQIWMESLCEESNGCVLREYSENPIKGSIGSPRKYVKLSDIFPELSDEDKSVSPPIRATKSEEDIKAEISLSNSKVSVEPVSSFEKEIPPLLLSYFSLRGKSNGKSIDELVRTMKDSFSKEDLVNLSVLLEMEIKNPVVKTKKEVAEEIITFEMTK